MRSSSATSRAAASRSTAAPLSPGLRMEAACRLSMRILLAIVGLALLTLTSGATAQIGTTETQETTGTTGTAAVTASASLIDTQGRAIGEVRLQQTPHGVLLKLDLKNATPGIHGLHVHEIGRCDAPSFRSEERRVGSA